ncbi:MAG TPA: DUF3857 domain-containing transglutaminase family protein [Pyrinomonadaceae bacterium]|nr:DUF3857 domain-containing transglutaminase family protein [Pyrinomonadaceae bacterium]
MWFAFSSIARAIFITGFLVLLVAQPVPAKQGFAVKPVPDWTRKVVPSIDPGTLPLASGSSSTRILDDRQIKVNGGSVERYHHYYERVDNTAGLEDLSQLRFYFEPSYQQLAIHFVRVLRGGATINSFKPSEVKVIQQENELDQQLYNGTNAVVIFINDLRVGDLVEYAYTISGDNPVLGGRFTETLYLGDSEPIQEILLRLVFPSNRTLSIKNDNTTLQPTRQILGSDTEYTWYAKQIPAVSVDDSVPGWYNPYPRVNLSEFRSWADVVNWALPFYQKSTLNNSELQAKIVEWMKESDAPARRAIRALRFVQDEIRYLGIEMGRYSHQPTAPEKVFVRRFGDCKDKSLLLSSILTAMGIDAAPALVSTKENAALDQWQPTPFAFDHVIVEARINGKTFWFDPTISFQRSTLENYYDPSFARALVLRNGSSALEKIPLPQTGAGSIDIVENYSGGHSGLPITLAVTRTYRGMRADELRYSFSTKSPADLGKNHLNQYADTTPGITADGLPIISDDQDSNTIVVKEKYLITELWKDGRHTFVAERIYDELQKPRVSQRTAPLEVTYPLSIRQTILIDLGVGFEFPLADDSLSDNSMAFEYRYSKTGNQLRMEFSLKTFADSVAVENIQRHLQILDQAQGVIGYDLAQGRSGVVIGSPNEPSRPFIVLAWLIILVPVLAFVVWLVRRRSRRLQPTPFSQRLNSRPGASPETAIPVSTAEKLETELTNFSCRCGARAYDVQSPPKRERFVYDGQRLIGLRMVCKACSGTSDLYLKPIFDQPKEEASLSTSAASAD